VVEILAYTREWYTVGERVWVRTSDGAIYACGYDSCRQETEAPTDCAYAELWSCERRPASLPRPPGKVVDSLKLVGTFPVTESVEQGQIYIVALQDGSLWIQRRVTNLLQTAIGVGLGLTFGLALALVVPVIVESVLKRKSHSS
jgi:hypothetical protein